MAEDAVDHAATLGKLDDRDCVTKTLSIHGHHRSDDSSTDFAFYGSDAAALRELMESRPDFARQLHPVLPIFAAQVVWAARYEMARTIDDVLARRTRWLFLDAKAALEMAPAVAELLAGELGRDLSWQMKQIADFAAIARNYLIRAL